MPFLKRWGIPLLTNLLVATVAGAMTLGVFEVALRFFYPQRLYRFPTGLFRSDPEVGFSFSPGFRGEMSNPEFSTQVRINSLGLRGPEIGEKKHNELRIMGVGDSFVAALNMDEENTFLSVLERELKASRAEKPIRVINAGTPNYGTWHEEKILKRMMSQLAPDLVVFCVFLENDLYDNLSPKKSVVEGGLLVDRVPHQGILPYQLRSWLQRRSMTYVFLWNAWNEIRPLIGKHHVDPMEQVKRITTKRPDPEIERGYALAAELLSRISSYVSEQETPLLLVLIPSQIQMKSDQFVEMLKGAGLDPLDFDLAEPNRRWAELGRSSRFPVLDLLPVFLAAPKDRELYMPLDGHLTVEGNRIAGEAIATALQELMDGERTGAP